MMEHRHSPRYPATEKVRVYVHGELIAETRAANLNRHGAFLELRELPVKRGCCFETELRIPGVDAAPSRRRSLVVHLSERGVGVMFL
jgi:hypothetical protein